MAIHNQAPSDDSVTSQLVRWVHSLTLADVPPAILERMRYLILDGISCALVASHLPWSEKAAKTMFEFEPQGKCAVWGYDQKLGPLAAAILNSSFVQGFEIDDWHSGAPCHSESIVLPALAAGAELVKSKGGSVTGADFLLAATIGFELCPRIGLGLYGSDLLSRGFHSGTLMGHGGSAAACAKLLHLSEKEIEHSLGTACTQACGLMSAQYGSDFKRMQHGLAARNGLFAALMSQGGYTGIEQVFDLQYGGFFAAFGDGSKRTPPYLPDELIKNIGTKWEIEQICVKPYSAQAGLHTMIDCLDKLVRENPQRMADFDGIANIHIEMGEVCYKHGCFDCPPPPLEITTGQMCAPYSAAVKLVDGDVFVEQFAHDQLNRPILWDIMRKVTMDHNSDFDVPPTPKTTTRVTVTFIDDVIKSVKLASARGMFPPLTNGTVLEKSRKLLDLVVTPERRDAIEAFILGIEKEEDVTALMAWLGGKVPAALQ